MTDASSDAARSPYRVLVVEDDPAIRRLVEKLLTRLKIEIDVAGEDRKSVV